MFGVLVFLVFSPFSWFVMHTADDIVDILALLATEASCLVGGAMIFILARPIWVSVLLSSWASHFVLASSLFARCANVGVFVADATIMCLRGESAFGDMFAI